MEVDIEWKHRNNRWLLRDNSSIETKTLHTWNPNQRDQNRGILSIILEIQIKKSMHSVILKEIENRNELLNQTAEFKEIKIENH